uniref:Large ribosomal subunit protein mL49 n=1 Tax=Culicoides sonorensis TaxID=179676 RepID=A0A336LTM0_CULSO
MSMLRKFSALKNINNVISCYGRILKRSSSFKSSEIFQGYEKHPSVEIVKNPPEWIHVEALLPQKMVPVPKQTEYSSIWKYPTVTNGQYPYMIYRNKNHMIPVYLKHTHRGLRKLTMVKRVDGDIWQLNKELKDFVEKKTGKEILTRVNEMSSQIHLRGDFVEIVSEYLMKKGF